MAELNIREQDAQYRANARDRADQIERGKTIFLQDYKNLERKLEKQLADPGLSFDQRMILGNRLTNLKLNWQENGVGDVSVVIAMRDNILNNLKESGTMKLSPSDETAIFGDQRAKLPQLNAIIAEANAKGLI